jgi:hypothetical protein
MFGLYDPSAYIAVGIVPIVVFVITIFGVAAGVCSPLCNAMSHRTIEYGTYLYGDYYYYLYQNGDDGKYNPDGSTKHNRYDMNSVVMHVSGTSGRNFNWGAFLPFGSSGKTLDNVKPETDRQALDRCLERAIGANCNVLVDIAQFNLTMSSVYGTLSRYTNCWRNLRKGRLADAARSLGFKKKFKNYKDGLTYNDAGNAWLEMQYGWKPLMSDIKGLADVLELQNSDARRWTVTGTSRFNKTVNYWGVPDPNYWGGAYAQIHYEFRYQYKCYLKENMSVPRTIGLYDPLSLAWEVIPYSFVVDWFIPIGDYLHELQVVRNLDAEWVVTKTGRTVYNGRQVPGSGGGDDVTYDDCRHMLLQRRTDFTWTDIPRPRLSGLEVLSPTRFTNALALLSQAVTRW